MSTTKRPPTGAQSKSGRKRGQNAGTLELRGRFWHAKLSVEVEGVRLRRRVNLGTDNRAVAVRKLAKLVAGELAVPEVAHAVETVREACERVHEARKADGVVDAVNEIARLRRFVYPEIERMPVTRVETRHVNAVLDAAKAAGKSQGTCQHLKQDIANVFAVLRREGVLKSSPVDDAELPSFPKVPHKERSVLTDHELVRYLAWQHPDEQYATGVRERQTMACVSRMFGGVRTGDLHGLCWEAFDLPGFGWGWAPRRKIRNPQRLAIPAMLRPILNDWWQRAGKPTEGPVFPCQRGKGAGEAKTNTGHAEAFRRDLRRAFRIDVPKYELQKRKGELVTVIATWEEARDLTPRERELFEETETTLPVDFHSWRRAFAQALADAGLNAQQAQALAGHSTMAAHERYLASASKMRALPEAALPKLRLSPVMGQPAKPRRWRKSKRRGVSEGSGSGCRDLNPEQPAPKTGLSGDQPGQPSILTLGQLAVSSSVTRSLGARGQPKGDNRGMAGCRGSLRSEDGTTGGPPPRPSLSEASIEELERALAERRGKVVPLEQARRVRGRRLWRDGDH